MVSSTMERKLVNTLWSVVEEIVLAEYSLIQDMHMRNSFYHLREILSKEIGTRITIDQYNYFLEKYEYYQSDKWPSWEEKHRIIRPTSKDPTLALYNGLLQALAYIDESSFFFSRCQGFLFIEKSGFINDLKILSSHGWVVLAGQGFCTRETREQIAKNYPDKPILVVHDFDYSGNQMFDVFDKGSKRTKHLDLTFDNVFDIGLNKEDIEELDLPLEPESEKYRDQQKWRVELNALTVLVTRKNIKNPLLWYVVKRMNEEGIPLHKEEESSWVALKWAITFEIRETLENIIDPIITEVLEDVKSEPIIDVALVKSFDLKTTDEFKEGIKKLSERLLEKAEYIDSFETEQKILFESQVIDELRTQARRRPELEKEDS